MEIPNPLPVVDGAAVFALLRDILCPQLKQALAIIEHASENLDRYRRSIRLRERLRWAGRTYSAANVNLYAKLAHAVEFPVLFNLRRMPPKMVTALQIAINEDNDPKNALPVIYGHSLEIPRT